jgi:hypothetical protein
MFVILYFTGSAITVYGPYASQAQAQQSIGNAVAGGSTSGSYFVLQVWPVSASVPAAPGTIATGNMVFVEGFTDVFGNSQFLVKGPFANAAAALAYQAYKAFPGGGTTATVQTPI